MYETRIEDDPITRVRKEEWIRRVDREVYISKRWYELAH